MTVKKNKPWHHNIPFYSVNEYHTLSKMFQPSCIVCPLWTLFTESNIQKSENWDLFFTQLDKRLSRYVKNPNKTIYYSPISALVGPGVMRDSSPNKVHHLGVSG